MMEMWDIALGTFLVYSILFAAVLPRVDKLGEMGIVGTLILCAIGAVLVTLLSRSRGYSKKGTKKRSRAPPKEESKVEESEDEIEIGYSSSEEE